MVIAAKHDEQTSFCGSDTFSIDLITFMNVAGGVSVVYLGLVFCHLCLTLIAGKGTHSISCTVISDVTCNCKRTVCVRDAQEPKMAVAETESETEATASAAPRRTCKWNCSRCGEFNHADNWQCRGCKNWDCSRCGKFNSADAWNVEITRFGAWQCSDCKEWRCPSAVSSIVLTCLFASAVTKPTWHGARSAGVK